MLELIYSDALKLAFGSGANMEDKYFNRLDQKTSNFLVMTGSITIFVFSYSLIALINEICIGIVCMRSCKFCRTRFFQEKAKKGAKNGWEL